MFQITEDPSSGSLVQCLAKNYKKDSIVSVDMDKVDVMAAYSDLLCVCVVHCIYSELHTRTMGQNKYTVYIYSELHTRTTGHCALDCSKQRPS